MCDAGARRPACQKRGHTLLLMQFCSLAITLKGWTTQAGSYNCFPQFGWPSSDAASTRVAGASSRFLASHPPMASAHGGRARASNPHQNRVRQPRACRGCHRWVLRVHVQGEAASYAPRRPSKSEKLYLLASGHKAAASAASSSAPTPVPFPYSLPPPLLTWLVGVVQGCRKEGGVRGGYRGKVSGRRKGGGRWLAAAGEAASPTHARLEARFLAWLRVCL